MVAVGCSPVEVAVGRSPVEMAVGRKIFFCS